MNLQAYIKPLFRLITLTRISLIISHLKNIYIYISYSNKFYKNIELIYNSSGNQNFSSFS